MSTKPCLSLTSATGTQLYVSVVSRGSCHPNINDFLIQNTVIPGDTSIQTAPLSKPLKKGEEVKLYQALMTITPILIGSVTIAADATIGATAIAIAPSLYTALSGDYGRSISLFELVGIESSPFQSSTELNQVTLLNSGGWMSKSPSQSQWNFQITGYIPVNTDAAQGYRTILNAFASKSYLYVERHLPNGDVKAGTTIVSSFSDQVQGAGYVQYQATFEGHEAPILDFVVPVSNPLPDSNPNPNPTPTVPTLAIGGRLLADWTI